MDSQQTAQVNSHQSVDSQQTLHDFVLNLLTDPDARSAFDLDPEGALQAAGLTDVTAADVQDVVPLVVDYAPGAGLASVAPVAGQLGIDPLTTDATDVIGQLQAVPEQISVNSTHSGVDATAGALGAIAVDPLGGYAGAAVLPGIGVGIGPGGLATDLTGVHDVAHTLDADVVGSVDGVTSPVVGDVAGTVANPLGATEAGVLHGDVLGGDLGVLSGTQAQVDGVVGSLGVDHTLGGLGLGDGTGVVPSVHVPATVDAVTQHVDGTLSGVGGTVNGVTGTVGGLTGGLTGDSGTHSDTTVHTDVHAGSDGGLLGGLF
ncbi:IniB N-terminal domain-containing protein [Micromonospora soli]|uniref:IniB N-terminal domain-containing protein n=1 Tax=Micromonospora sp. NBRC 110009 TaxID=3061627 RepID=UPI002671C791|nr:IniB N-terminal domain-containing protein [Micromonospora sp. NBRC 110009]WKU00356.1 IniB N-terminal domain-containing protein [Micromonospora sp. NBRC 110009]